MPRPKKCRRICSLPESSGFVPINGGEGKKPIILGIDEYEVVRLIDKEGLSQEECGTHMKIARTSVQLIYASARKKIAEALVDSVPLKIEGGDYKLCDGRESPCGFGNCWKQQNNTKILKQKSVGGTTIMKVAVTYENGQIFQHFGHTAQFKIYDVDQGKIVSTAVVNTNGSGHGALAGFLQELQVDTLICGGIGGGAQTALGQAGIRICGGVSGDADEAVASLLSDSLVFSANATCDHHHDGEHEHTCGEHGCGEHHCGG
jgi:predicted DNA-binding protein (UPF0251 family)/predicted Fe-Mo cluster-binding NifX family protein